MFDIAYFCKMSILKNPPKEGDYTGSDGLLYCGKCHTPKRCFVTDNDGKKHIGSCPCECDRNEKAEQEALKRRESAERRRDRAFENARSLKAATFEADDRKNAKLSDGFKAYAKNFDPKTSGNLILLGSVGTGKSFYAACVLNEVISNGYSGMFATVSDIAAELRDFSRESELRERIRRVDLLVLDDLGAERSNTDYSAQMRFDVINTRYQSGKPTVFTTNLKTEQLFDKSGDVQTCRVLSRVREGAKLVPIVGDDRRNEGLR